MPDIFIVVDVQRDFCAGGALEVPNSESLIQPLNEAIEKAVSFGMLIIFTRDWHPENHSSFREFGGQWLHTAYRIHGEQSFTQSAINTSALIFWDFT